ncbi:MAG: cytochrome c peroxidase [Thiohalocapsa sp.]
MMLAFTGSVRGTTGQTEILAPFYTGAEYEPPAVGSYRLPPLGEAADGAVLRSDGSAKRLHELFGGKLVLLSFIYSSCSDVNGCPLATAVMYQVQRQIAEDPALRDRFKLISLSFDPVYDTPEVMSLYGKGLAGRNPGGNHWEFLTTASQQDLAPILDAYGQTIIRDIDEQGEPRPSLSHILRVFLIDPDKQIRNIYSVSFLYPELIVNDAKTALAEFPVVETAAVQVANAPTLSQAGDYKGGYDSSDYRTRSKSVQQRDGESADLVALATESQLGLPPVPVPADNPLTQERVALGRKLFFDRRLSLNDTFSCAMCHIPEQGFTSNEMATAVGFEGRSVRRNSPSLYNVAYARVLFHDGREETLEQQVWAPLLARNEMANPSVGAVLKKLRKIPDYAGRFEAVFDGRGPGMETLGQALAAYQRTLVSGNSPFDRWHFGGDETALDAAAKRGFALFTGEAGCVSCHSVGKDQALFTDHQLHNTGLGYQASMGIRPPKKRVTLAPGVFVDVDWDIIDDVGEAPPSDLGLYEITQDPNDRWKYRTPSLRNVALSAPYMHDGSLGSLEDVVRFYDHGGVPNPLLDPRLRPLGLSDQEVGDLVAFMRSLTGGNVDTLVSDAFAAPVGDITTDDPNWAHD